MLESMAETIKVCSSFRHKLNVNKNLINTAIEDIGGIFDYRHSMLDIYIGDLEEVYRRLTQQSLVLSKIMGSLLERENHAQTILDDYLDNNIQDQHDKDR